MTQSRFTDAEKLIRADLIDVEPYEPIAPLEVLSARSGVPVEELIKLDGNENPYGPSPRVARALAEYQYFHIYPDPLHRMIAKRLSEYVGVDKDYIVCGAGSDELIDLTLRVLLEPGDKVVNCPPTFGMYSFSTEVCGGKVTNVPRQDGYEIDVKSIDKAVDKKTKAVFIASPNNPTGNATPNKVLRELLNVGAMVIIDEAYYEFHGQSMAGMVPEFPNLIVLRSFSKWAGLGGLRIGYGIFPLPVAEMIRRIKIPYNVNSAAMVAVRESLADLDYLQANVDAIVKERDRMSKLLMEQEVLRPMPSQANFVLCQVKKANALMIKEGLETRGIIVRHFEKPLLSSMLRISVGKPEHTDALVAALDRWKEQ